MTWHGPYRVNERPANTAIFPWSVAGDSGKIDIVYYGTSHSSAAGETPDSYPATAAWHVYSRRTSLSPPQARPSPRTSTAR